MSIWGGKAGLTVDLGTYGLPMTPKRLQRCTVGPDVNQLPAQCAQGRDGGQGYLRCDECRLGGDRWYHRSS